MHPADEVAVDPWMVYQEMSPYKQRNQEVLISGINAQLAEMMRLFQLPCPLGWALAGAE